MKWIDLKESGPPSKSCECWILERCLYQRNPRFSFYDARDEAFFRIDQTLSQVEYRGIIFGVTHYIIVPELPYANPKVDVWGEKKVKNTQGVGDVPSPQECYK